MAEQIECTRPSRPCMYCLESDANACVRTQPDEAGGAHIYAHKKCAEKRGVDWLYVFTDQPTVGDAR